jgi:lysophospholipase L1-like esterase
MQDRRDGDRFPPSSVFSSLACRVLKKLKISLVVVVVLALLLEVAAHLYIKNGPGAVFAKYATIEQIRKRWNDEMSLVRHYYLGYIPNPGYVKGSNRHDSLGFRGDGIGRVKPAGQFRIACLGGSTTYDIDVEDYTKSYPAVLERLLRERTSRDVRVINAGVPGWTTWESLINLQLRVLDLEPDLIIVYHGVNDVAPRLSWPPERYRSDNSQLHSVPSTILWPSVFEHSALGRMAMTKWGGRISHMRVDRAFGTHGPGSWSWLFGKQKADGTYPRGIFTEVSPAEMLERNPPTYFRRNVESMVAIAQSRGIEVVLASFALSTQSQNMRDLATLSEEYRTAIDESNQVLREIAGRTGARFIDFAALMPHEARYFTNPVHNTAAGAEVKARLFCDSLTEQGWVISAGAAVQPANPSGH